VFVVALTTVVAGCAWGSEFDREEWLAAGNGCGDDSPRQEMVGDLVDNRLNHGMKRSEILAMLGKPPYRDAESLEYGVGLRGSCEFLYLEFDSAGRLDRWHRTES
jgi:hypothetical protein